MTAALVAVAIGVVAPELNRWKPINYPALQRGDAAVVVTGATSGIGLSAARRLASMGFHVYAGYRSSESAPKLEASLIN